MVPKKLYYVSRLRVPSEKAHSFQVIKMCQAYAEQGLEVTLIVPDRVNTITQDLFSYYGVPDNFRCDFVKVPNLIKNTWWGRFGFWIEGAIFLWRSRQLIGDRDSIIVSRSIEVSLLYSLRHYTYVVFEMHDWPKSFVRLYVYLLRKIKYIVVTSQGLFDVCNEYRLNSLVAHNGVDESFFTVSAQYKREDFDIPSNKKVVMYIGSLQAWKGVQTLLDASQFFVNQVKTVIIGGSSEEVLDLQKRYPNVLFLGQRPTKDLVYYQQLADILVVPNSTTDDVSTRFTSPIKLFAHLTARKPIIASRIPSIESVVTDKEIFFFDGSAEDLVVKVNQVVGMDKTEYQTKIDNAFSLSKSFTWQNRAKIILSYITR